MKSFRELIAWRKAMNLVILIYQQTSHFPGPERLALANQLNRSVVSIPSNLAEGWARHSRKDFLSFIYIARGSLAEVETQTEISHRLGYITPEAYGNLQQQTEELSKILTGLIKSLRAESATITNG